MENSSEDSDSEAKFDEESIIKYYFDHGYTYEEIVLLLGEQHNHQISYSILLRCLKSYGLSKRGFFDRDDSHNVTELVRRCICEVINGPGSCAGYRTVWHMLRMEGLHVPRIIVQDLLKELDPESTYPT